MDFGIVSFVIGSICTFFYFVGGHLIRHHLATVRDAQKKSDSTINEKFKDLGQELYQVRSSVRKLSDDIIVLKSDIKSLSENVMQRGNEVRSLGRNFIDYGTKVNERLDRIETGYVTILKGFKK